MPSLLQIHWGKGILEYEWTVVKFMNGYTNNCFVSRDPLSNFSADVFLPPKKYTVLSIAANEWKFIFTSFIQTCGTDIIFIEESDE